MAGLILDQFADTDDGHCARIDFLERAEAEAVCRAMLDGQQDNRREGMIDGMARGRLQALILTGERGPDRDVAGDRVDVEGELYVTADRAIELRNRKQGRLCLFVPSDVVDAAASSLGNSFAPIDGRSLHEGARDRFIRSAPASVAEAARRCFALPRAGQTVSESDRLAFVEAALDRFERGEAESIGLELWRIGLLPDARPDFLEYLTRNRTHVQELSRPGRIHSSLRDRLQRIAVDELTAASLLQFFDGRALHDVRRWARDLIDAELTYDRWRFVGTDKSDLRSVTVDSFLDANGVVKRLSKLTQPHGPTGALVAQIGKKRTLATGWKTDPLTPANLARWRVEIVPVTGELDDATASLPAREIDGKRNKATISLDLDLDVSDLPDAPMWVRVTPLAADGNEILNETGEPIIATSEEFYFEQGGELPPGEGRLSTSPTLALARLRAMYEHGDLIVEEQPHWAARDLDYFELRLNGRVKTRLGLTAPLRALQALVLAQPRQGGRYLLECPDMAVASAETFVAVQPPDVTHEKWTAFWQARDRFFRRIVAGGVRNIVEVADWSSDLAGAAIRYAQAYRDLVDALTTAASQSGRLRQELEDALSLDTLCVRSVGLSGGDETALVVLPTHPLRAAWYASYSQLLVRWEGQLHELQRADRRRALSLPSIEKVMPTNVPPFAYWPGQGGPYVFFQNLRFFHGVALPADAPDPHRRFADVAYVLGAGSDSSAGDLRPARLAEHVREYRDLRPYVHRMELTLVNPDRGELVADTLDTFLQRERAGLNGDDVTDPSSPTFAIRAYLATGREMPLRGLERIRSKQAEEYFVGGSDVFMPTLESSVKTLADLDDTVPEEAHLAIAADLAQPRIVPSEVERGAPQESSFSLHGLIARWLSILTSEGDQIRWQHRLGVETTARPEPHPAGARFSDTVMDLQASLLHAGGQILTVGGPAVPVLEVRVSAERRRLLETLHQQSDWVISIDRFFGPDYYDSPREPDLAQAARKYVLDYAPDYGEGLGHRVVVTTAWQEDVLRRLRGTVSLIGLAQSEDAARVLLDHIKMVSGRLALRALAAEPGNAQAVSLAATIAWLRMRGRLEQAVFVPLSLHGGLFDASAPSAGSDDDRGDGVLVTLRRNIVEATFMTVRWRRGSTDVRSLAYDMTLALEHERQQFERQFFDEARIDGAFQRAQLASVLRFYFERSRRHGLFADEHVGSFLDHLARIEKTGLDFRPKLEGFVVTAEEMPTASFSDGDAIFTVLGPSDLERATTLDRLTDGARLKQERQAPLDFEDGAEPSEPANASVTLADRASDTTVPSLGATVSSGDEADAVTGADTQGVSTAQPLDEQSVETAALPAPKVEPSSGSSAAAMTAGDADPTPEDPSATAVVLGHAVGGAAPVLWEPSVQGSPHMFVLGIPGQGKSWAIARAVGEMARQRVPSLILDFHGQFTGRSGPLAGARQSTVLDARDGLPFSPFEVAGDLGDAIDWRTNAFAISEIFGYVCKLGDMQRDVVFTAVRDAYRTHGFGDDPEKDEDEARARTYPTLQEVLGRIERQERAGRASNVAARCRPLLEMDVFRPPASGGEDLLSIIRRGLVIDLHRLADLELLQLAVGAFVLRKLYKDMFTWGEADRLRLLVVLDEAHRLARDVTLPKLMKEGRKFGIAVVVASQGMADFHLDVLGTAGTKVIFRTNHPDSRKVAGFIRAPKGVDLAARIEQLAVGHAYIQTPEMRTGSITRMASPRDA
ncbi:MAG: ATP-binding protein [Chloroflexi bacterium]|nr:ATP-binding protein [Chloroflexota bacterium]